MRRGRGRGGDDNVNLSDVCRELIALREDIRPILENEKRLIREEEEQNRLQQLKFEQDRLDSQEKRRRERLALQEESIRIKIRIVSGMFMLMAFSLIVAIGLDRTRERYELFDRHSQYTVAIVNRCLLVVCVLCLFPCVDAKPVYMFLKKYGYIKLNEA